ncbi:tRNA (adenosine(37)-N6)-threonylcarbamoyltransferase complex dimerization subunit type 1 TsaB [Spiroplasma endosymbiont of Agriotes lineatus]|uniref:tRNA (adenosine(37)-N6)-threonylcarbamoyltransferase complex dimerization subunit type 1 TsaB n=1 Tax=Spiroplasma endosymbiont of Agriotes lineatus TaxID=3077930 RepID=UPI0030D27597
MKTLFLDTTNGYLVIILQDDRGLLDSLQIWNHQKHTERATVLIDEMLTNNKLSWFDIDGLYLTVGPGSYTGIRVGITIAKTMKAVNEALQVFVTNSLLLQVGNKQAISVINAKTDQFFVAVYDNLNPSVLEQVVTRNNLFLLKKEWKKFKLIEDYHRVDLVENFLQIKHLCKKVTNVDDLKALYLKELQLKKHYE